jgi:hypothetical protein
MNSPYSPYLLGFSDSYGRRTTGDGECGNGTGCCRGNYVDHAYQLYFPRPYGKNAKADGCGYGDGVNDATPLIVFLACPNSSLECALVNALVRMEP